MTPAQIRAATILEKTTQVQAMLAGIRDLPLATLREFRSDARNPAAAESYLRRALEGLLDLGRHMLAKGFGRGPVEYKEIAVGLVRVGLLDEAHGALLLELAGYRNRLVHFYDEIAEQELYEICTKELSDIESVLGALLEWAREHPQSVDGTL